MATAWGGADPTQTSDTSDYELSCEYLANADLTITHVRVWAGSGELGFSGRKARIWSTTGTQLGIATLPDLLPTGWSTYALDAVVTRTTGQRFKVSYSTGGRYGALTNALNSAVNSADGNVTALAGASGTHGNGSFNTTPAQFPATASGNNSFYGIDCQYTLGIGGNTPPRITQLTAVPAGAVVTVTVVAEDDETLAGAAYRYTWGDGTADTVSSSTTAQHTYATSGTYAVLVTVTDADGLSDYAAVPVTVVVPASDLGSLDSRAVIEAVRSHALASGLFDRAPGHEPKSKPGTGLTCAVWVQRGPTPVAARSGLAATSVRLILNVRVYTSMLADPQDEIDPRVVEAVDTLMATYNGDYTLGGLVAEVDVLGAHGIQLDAVAGYLQQDGAIYRVMTITLPVIINNAWEQSP